jgi:hypothetical protein
MTAHTASSSIKTSEGRTTAVSAVALPDSLPTWRNQGREAREDQQRRDNSRQRDDRARHR